MTAVTKVIINGARGERGAASGPLGAGSVTPETISDALMDKQGILEKIGGFDEAAGKVGYSPAATYLAKTTAYKLQNMPVGIDDISATKLTDGDPIADILDEIQTDLIPGGGEIVGGRKRAYKIERNVDLKRGVTIRGFSYPNKYRAALPGSTTYPSTLIVPPDVQIANRGGRIIGWTFWRGGLVTPTSQPEFFTALAAYDGVPILGAEDDAWVSDCTFIGFERPALFSDIWRPEFYNNGYDCRGGPEVTGCYDCGNMGISFNRAWGYLNANSDWDWATTLRDLEAIYIHDGADGLRVEKNFSYGHKWGLRIADTVTEGVIAGVTASHFADGPAGKAFAGESSFPLSTFQGTKGLSVEGECYAVTIHTSKFWGQDVGMRLANTGGPLQMVGNTVGFALSNQVELAAGSFGDLGQLSTDDKCQTPVLAEPGVQSWIGGVFSDSEVLGPHGIIKFDSADRNKLHALRIHQRAPGAFSNDLNGGTASEPTTRPHPDVASGLYLDDAADSLGLAVKGKRVMRLKRGLASVNDVLISAGDTGVAPKMEATGTDANIDLELSGKGSGTVKTSGNLEVKPPASATPSTNGTLTFEATSNTQVKIKLKGSDGTVRSASLTLS